MTRTAAALGSINLGHFLPDYTAYEELLEIFRGFAPIPILLERERGTPVDALLPTLGGQTALNCACALSDNGTLDEFGVIDLGFIV